MEPINDCRIREIFAFDKTTTNSIAEAFTDQPKRFDSLDSAIDKSIEQELFPINDVIRGLRKPPTKRRKTTDRKPIAFVTFNTRSAGKPKTITLKALLDSGASGTLVLEKHARKLKLLKTKTNWAVPGGSIATGKMARARFVLPELHDNRMIEWNVHLAKSLLGSYDMIIGRDILTELEIDIKFSDQTVVWDEHDMPFKDVDDTPETYAMHIKEQEALVEGADRLKAILDAKYEAADLEKYCSEQTHLSAEEQQKLLSLFRKHETLFDGTLGTWTGTKYNIELKDGVKPYHAKAFPMPKIHVDTLKLEVKRLCEIGVLKKVNRSEWACPTFIIPKKDGSVRFISDFRELNKRILRKPYPIPKIQDMLLKLEGFKYATSLDLNMGYYHIELTPDSKKYCTIVLPFGKYEYQRLPMGLSNSPDIFQEKMSELMEGLDFVRTYIDDLLCITAEDYDDHLVQLDMVLERIKHAGLKCNINKSFFAKGELEYLGYWITRKGI